MKKLNSGIIVVCLSISAGALAADSTVATPMTTRSVDAEKLAAEQSDKSSLKTNCIRDTGSRLRAKDKHGCNGLPGRSYTKADIDLTGANTLAEALQRLDPSVQFGR